MKNDHGEREADAFLQRQEQIDVRNGQLPDERAQKPQLASHKSSGSSTDRNLLQCSRAALRGAFSARRKVSCLEARRSSRKLTHCAITVAIAAPAAHMAGRPSLPKIRISFSPVFRTADTVPAYSGSPGFSAQRNAVERSVEPARGRNVPESSARYEAAACQVGASFV